MADAKDCPMCRLVNPPHALRCDCGYDFSTGQVLGSYLSHQAAGSPTGCQDCGVEAETRYVSFHQHVGALIVWLHSSFKGRLCKDCINRQFWGKTIVTLIFGWWGVISFFATPFVLLNNICRYLSCLGMAPPLTQAPGSGTTPGGGRPRGQPVGRNCVHCGERISCDLDGRFCRACGSPVHGQCARPGEGTGCTSCGATVSAQ